jgi:small redox-active disulfide protein 2
MSENNTNKGSPVKVLGTGCAKCDKLTASVNAALAQLGKSIEVEHVKDLKQIVAFGVMRTPALVINGKVKSVGKVPNVDELKELLQKHL